MKHILISSLVVLLSACTTTTKLPESKQLDNWTSPKHENIQYGNAEQLHDWWKNFDDPTLNKLIEFMLIDSPDRQIAKARISEARGMRRSTRSFLFPQIGASTSTSRQDFGFVAPGTFTDSGFDASFELDFFGRNQKNLSAADASLAALESQYYNTTLSLIAEVSRTYIEYRGSAKQVIIAQKNLNTQQKTLELISSQKNLGAATQLDEERAKNLVNTTASSIPEFQRLANNARLRLSVLTGQLPPHLLALLSTTEEIPTLNVAPILLSPANVLALRPDLQAASSNLTANTLLAESAITELWPTFTLSGFFGQTEGAFTSTATIWNLTLGAAVNLIDFGRIEGRIDAAKARERIAYEQYRRTMLDAISEVERALNDYTSIEKRIVFLRKAYDNANRALELSQNLYREGEISFLDILDAQRTVNTADSALVDAEVLQAESLIGLYKSLGVY